MIANILAAGGNPLEHVVDHDIWNMGPVTILSNHILMIIAAGLLVILFIPRMVRVPAEGDEVQRLTPRGARNGIEVICQMLREFVARPALGPHTDRFIPYIWSVFFFILAMNILGLLPLEPLTKPVASMFGLHHGFYGAATGNIWVTGTLATCTFLMIVVNGLRLHGLSYVKHFFMGPFPLSLLIAVLEVIGLCAKGFALAIRLFANMMAGHILLAVLLGFIFTAGAASAMMGISVALPVVLGSVAINMLELFVAFLQAFIFTFLSCVFIGEAVNMHHDDAHHEEGHHDHEQVAGAGHHD